MTVLAPYRSPQAPGRSGFGSLLRAEWTKFRTVRGWLIGLLVGVLLIVGLGALTGANSQCSFQPNANMAAEACPAPPTGPGGEWVTDSFYLVHQPLAGDGSITARVTSLTGLYSTHGGVAAGQSPTAGMTPGVQPWAKAGIIIKASQTAGSAYAAMMVTGTHGVRMQWNFTNDVAGMAGKTSAASPRWLRLTRSGNVIRGYDSADGTHWTLVGTATLAGLPTTAAGGAVRRHARVHGDLDRAGHDVVDGWRRTGHRRLRSRDPAGCLAGRGPVDRRRNRGQQPGVRLASGVGAGVHAGRRAVHRVRVR